MYYFVCVKKIYKATTLSPTIMEVENMTILEDLVSSFRAPSEHHWIMIIGRVLESIPKFT